MVNSEREKVWRERVGQWQASGLSQRAYAIERKRSTNPSLARQFQSGHDAGFEVNA